MRSVSSEILGSEGSCSLETGLEEAEGETDAGGREDDSETHAC